MIAEISKASSDLFSALSYNFKKVEAGEAELLMTKNLPTDLKPTAGDTNAEMRKRIPSDARTRNITFHVSLNPDPTETIDDETYRRIAEDYMTAMGYGEQPYIVLLHHDIARAHIHIVSTRVDSLGRKINDQYERRKSQQAIARIEEKYRLKQAPKTKHRREQTTAQRPKKVDGKASDVKAQINRVVRFVIKYGTFQTIGEMNALLQTYNVAAEITKNEYKGKIYEGIVYSPTDDASNKIGSPIDSNKLGRGTGIHAVRYAMKRSKDGARPCLPVLKKTIQEAMRGDPDPNLFTRRMHNKGIEFVPRINDSGRIYGVTFVFPDKMVALNGSHLGKQFSANVFNRYFHHELKGNPFVVDDKQFKQSYQHPSSTEDQPDIHRWTLTGGDSVDLSLLEATASIVRSQDGEYEEEQQEIELQQGIRKALQKKKRRKINN